VTTAAIRTTGPGILGLIVATSNGSFADDVALAGWGTITIPSARNSSRFHILLILRWLRTISCSAVRAATPNINANATRLILLREAFDISLARNARPESKKMSGTVITCVMTAYLLSVRDCLVVHPPLPLWGMAILLIQNHPLH
jgi:hypothetical protein